MAKDYYRFRLNLDPLVEKEQECIEYLQGFDGRIVDAGRELLLLGLEAKKGNLINKESGEESKKQMTGKIQELQSELDAKEKECKNLSAEISKREKEIVELKYTIKELSSTKEVQPVYDAIIAHHTSPEDDTASNVASRKLFSKKGRKPVNEVVKYEASEKHIDDFESLEEYAINKKLDPGVMTMIACALDNHISYRIIYSMIENELDPRQMRAVIDLIKAKQKRDIESIK